MNGSISYSYDAEGRILSSNGTTFVYDGDGYRVKKVESAPTLYWPGPTGQIIDESNSGATSFGRQVYFGGLLIWSEDTSGSGRFLFQDHLGSTRVTMNTSGTVQDDIDYAPFGEQLANYGAGTDNHYNFTGYETDDDQSKYATFRNLYSVQGRFNRPDPYSGSYDLSNPQSLNRYSYVRNNPVNAIDLVGLNELGGETADGQAPCFLTTDTGDSCDDGSSLTGGYAGLCPPDTCVTVTTPQDPTIDPLSPCPLFSCGPLLEGVSGPSLNLLLPNAPNKRDAGNPGFGGMSGSTTRNV